MTVLFVTESLAKSHVKGYTKTDGTVVKPHEDKRVKASKPPAKWSSGVSSSIGGIKAPQYGFGKPPQSSSWGGYGGSSGSLFSSAPKPEPKAWHPKLGDKGQKVGIYSPHAPSVANLSNPGEIATITPGCEMPEELNGIPFAPWTPPEEDQWDYVDGQMDDLVEPELHCPKGKEPASGLVIVETDGRVWLVSPTNKFGGYCVPQDSSEILTRSGWKKHNEVVVGDETIGFNVEKGVSEWTPVLAVQHFNNLPMVRFGGSKWSVRCTKDHRWLAKLPPNSVENKSDRVIGDAHWDVINRRHAEKQEERLNKEYLMMRTENISGASRLIVRAAPHVSDDESDITPREAAIIAWIITDGKITKSRHGKAVTAMITQAKQTGIDELDKLLAGTRYTRYDKRSFDGWYEYHFPAAVFRGLLARTGWDGCKESIPGLVLRLSNDALKAFYHACWVAEGDETRSTRLWQNDGPVQDAMAIVGYRLGSAPVVSGKKKCKSISMNLATRRSNKSHVVEDGEAPAWCVTTGLGTWTMRQGGVVTLTGNCNTFPKGKVEPELSFQANAIKEAWEEGGIKANIVGLLGDVERTTSVTRYYLARRVAGNPAEAITWESQAVHLCPISKLTEFLDAKVDHSVVDLLAG